MHTHTHVHTHDTDTHRHTHTPYTHTLTLTYTHTHTYTYTYRHIHVQTHTFTHKHTQHACALGARTPQRAESEVLATQDQQLATRSRAVRLQGTGWVREVATSGRGGALLAAKAHRHARSGHFADYARSVLQYFSRCFLTVLSCSANTRDFSPLWLSKGPF